MNNVILQPVKPEHLHQVWNTVRPGIEKAASYGNWLPEDAYSMIQCGKASLYLWIVDDRYAGSIILIKKSEFDGMKLNIFSLYVEQEYSEYIDKNMYQIDELGRQYGCSKINFTSTRRAWDKRASRLGFEPKMTTYEKDI